MSSIEVGEYIRLKWGTIDKVRKIIDKKIYIEHLCPYNENEISKHSKNIIDLIEVGDIVHTRDVLNEDYYYMFDEEMVQATKETIESGIDLVDILTHEIYKQNCYRKENK